MKCDSDLRIGLRNNSEAPSYFRRAAFCRAGVRTEYTEHAGSAVGPAGSQALASGAAAPRLGGAKHMSKSPGVGKEESAGQLRWLEVRSIGTEILCRPGTPHFSDSRRSTG